MNTETPAHKSRPGPSALDKGNFGLDALEYTAQCTAAEMQPTALRRLFNRVARCPTCGRTLLSASDILQAVVAL
jgi:hypothetical protein